MLDFKVFLISIFCVAHPKAAQWNNRKIDHYEEWAFICGNDKTTGEFVKSSREELGIPDSNVSLSVDQDNCFELRNDITLDDVKIMEPIPPSSS